jgi:CheY-like chemotaxis protein
MSLVTAPLAQPSPTIAAVLLPGERSRVDAAGNGCFSVVHRDSITDALRVVRERPVDAVLVSVHRCAPEQVEALAHLVRDFPAIPMVALVSQHDAGATEMLLRLGATGVRRRRASAGTFARCWGLPRRSFAIGIPSRPRCGDSSIDCSSPTTPFGRHSTR